MDGGDAPDQFLGAEQAMRGAKDAIGENDLERATQQQSLALYAARTALLRVQSERLVQRINLYLALGGSFAERPPEPAAAGENAAPK